MATDPGKSRHAVRITTWAERPIDIASLAVFRILFGLMMAGAMVRFLARGWVREFYTGPAFHFTYPGLAWVRPWPEALMHAHFVLLALLALGMAAGFFYRTCTLLFLVGFTYVELLDQTAYLNHYYLISLLGGLLVFLPANRAWSIDALRKPDIQSDTAPAWCLNILRFQVGIVYLFAGLAKCNADWLLRAEPLRIWLSARSDMPWLGPLLCQSWTAYAASWFGAIFDLSIVFLLLWRSTRRTAFAFVVFFHVATWMLFNIGMFPWIMMVAATVFFSPDWPRAWVARLPRTWRCAESSAVPQAVQWRATPLFFAAIGIYAIVQLGLPLRPYLAVERPTWTCANFNCAWQVMVAEKTGYAEFNAFDPVSDKRWRVPIKDYLTARQEVMMAQDPYLIRAMARRIASDLRRQGFAQVQVNVEAFATLNGRPSQRLIDPKVDLAKAHGSDWILAFNP